MTIKQKIFIDPQTKAIDLVDHVRAINASMYYDSKEGAMYLQTRNGTKIYIVLDRGKLEDGYDQTA